MQKGLRFTAVFSKLLWPAFSQERAKCRLMPPRMPRQRVADAAGHVSACLLSGIGKAMLG